MYLCIYIYIDVICHWGRIEDIHFERHGLPLPLRCIDKMFKVSSHYFVLFFHKG